MPGGDGTGPMGMGPMTGRAAGYCAVNPVPGYANPVSGRGRGFGFGRGWGRGRGRSLAWRHGWVGYGPAWGYEYGAVPYAPEFTPQQEAEMLRKEAKAMQDEINFINQRITELESAVKKSE